MKNNGTIQLESDRLILRKIKLADAEEMFNNWANDQDVTKFLTWPPHKDVSETKQIIQNWINNYDDNKFYLWAIELKSINQIIGTIEAMKVDDVVESTEIGYCIGKKWWHQGIMSEALQLVIDYLFKVCEFNRITARHDVNNPNSGKVMLKCHMQCEGIFKKAGVNNQGICDEKYYAILKEDYLKI